MTRSVDETAMPLMGTSAVAATTPVREGISALPTSCRPLLPLFRASVGVKTQTLVRPRRIARFFITLSCTCLPNPKKLGCVSSPIFMRRITPACEREHSQKTFSPINIELPLRARLLRGAVCIPPHCDKRGFMAGLCCAPLHLERKTWSFVPPQYPCAAGRMHSAEWMSN
jgi:hypothetical protein